MKLKPCPFCGAKTVDGMITHSNECFIHKLIYMHPAGEVENAWQIRATDPLLKEMAEALLIAKDIINRYANNNKRIAGYSNIEDALQKYHEQEGSSE